MTVRIVIDPNVKPMDFDKFCQTHPPRSIAGDGYCKSGPMYRAEGPYRNFNHHDETSRDDTLVSCAQGLVAVRKGLYDRFCVNGVPDATLFINDIDPDASTLAIILKYPYLMQGVMNPLINRMVDMIHHLDMSGGLWPFPENLPSLEVTNWVFDPYWRHRMSGELQKKDAKTFMSVFEDIEHRFFEYLAGRAKSKPLDLDYDELGGGPGWTMVREIGAQARIRMLGKGIRAFVSVRNGQDGRWIYTICRYADYTPFPIEEICAELNKDEEPENQFGGGNIVIGNAYGQGSVRSPDAIQQCINAVMSRKKM